MRTVAPAHPSPAAIDTTQLPLVSLARKTRRLSAAPRTQLSLVMFANTRLCRPLADLQRLPRSGPRSPVRGGDLGCHAPLFRPEPCGLGLTFNYGWRHRPRRVPFIPIVRHTCQAHERGDMPLLLDETTSRRVHQGGTCLISPTTSGYTGSQPVHPEVPPSHTPN